MARIYQKSDCLFSSLGIALLVLSIVLVPANGVLGDNGGKTKPLAVGCLRNDGCNNGNCYWTGYQCMQNDPVYCQWNLPGCDGCTCRVCLTGTGAACNCQCQLFNGTCASGQQCNPN
jgi:hypothetical protein